MSPPPNVKEPDIFTLADEFDIVIVCAEVLAVKVTPVLKTEKEFNMIVGTLVIVKLLNPKGIITLSSSCGSVLSDQLSAFVHLSLVPPPSHVLVVCPNEIPVITNRPIIMIIIRFESESVFEKINFR